MVGAVATPDQGLDHSPRRIRPARLHISRARQWDVVVGRGREASAFIGDIADLGRYMVFKLVLQIEIPALGVSLPIARTAWGERGSRVDGNERVAEEEIRQVPRGR